MQTKVFGRACGKRVTLASAPNDQEHMAARRSEERINICQRGIIHFGSEEQGHPCLIRDISPKGARIEILGASMMPRIFWLKFEEDGYQVQSQLRWGDNNKYGIRFLGPILPG